MTKLRCLLVDDEPPALDILRSYIAATPMLEVAGECHHAIAAFEFLQHSQVDIIFLDINLPRLRGTDFLKALTNPPRVIFTTAYPEYALDGFELGATDYLLKPYSFERFLRAVQRANASEVKGLQTKDQSQHQTERFLYVRADRKMTKVLVDEIQYIESLKDYVKIFLPGKQIISKQTISALEEMLPENTFIRIHRSFIVSLKHVESYTATTVFIGKHELPVGPLYRHIFLQKISNT